jgi:pimeloyl-ACP methyl ester carboxylesterase
MSRPVLLALGAMFAVAVSAGARADYQVREIGSFYVGGHEVQLRGLPQREISFSAGMVPVKVDPNGEFETGQMYVQYVRLAQPSARYPMLLWHGGGLTGTTWETKPDGKPGWQQFFLGAGHDVYVSDAVERGRASWSRFPEIYGSEPFFRSEKEAWELFRIGPPGSYDPAPEKRVAFDGERFPTAAFEQFAKEFVPRWSSNDAATQAAYDAEVRKVCPCVIVVHSQGGNFGYNAALNNPDLVKALVLIEPSGAPDPAKADAAAVRGIPHLVIWGDNLDRVPPWPAFRAPSERWRDAIVKAGGIVNWVELPKLGIQGNSHMIMMDDDSDQIAGIVQDWLAKHGM